MTLLDRDRRFVVAAGSVTGRAHRLAERDGQDGFAVVSKKGLSAAVVTDGCSSGRASEIGARLGARWLAAMIERSFLDAVDPVAAAEAVTGALVAHLEILARSLTADGTVSAARVEETLLFTFVAAVVGSEHAIVFGVGDGTVLVDDVLNAVDAGPDNAPPYAAYALFDRDVAPVVHHVGPADGVRRIAVATDGIMPAALVRDLADTSELEENPSLLRKRLLVLADRERFADDATIAVLRRSS